MEIYLDNAATTQPLTQRALQRHLKDLWYNPSAVYRKAEDVFSEIKRVRRLVMAHFGQPDGCVFTSGGTEANNMAITALCRRGGRCITSTIEHPSVYEMFRYLEQNGVHVDYVKPRGYSVHPDDVAALVTAETALVSVMHVNNETGAVNDICAIGRAAKAKNPDVLVHSDGVQALLKIPMDFGAGVIDAYSVSAHKIHALKGTGALLTRKGVRLRPLLHGGGQEQTLRSGTENTLGIMSFGEALENGAASYEADMAHVSQLRKELIGGLGLIEDAVVNQPENGVPHIVSVSFGGVRSEVLARVMGEKGVCIGTGSACSRGKLSRVLLECGIGRAFAEGTVRISFSAQNTEDDVSVCLEELKSAVAQLRRFARR